MIYLLKLYVNGQVKTYPIPFHQKKTYPIPLSLSLSLSLSQIKELKYN